MRKNAMPDTALADGFWTGEIPAALRDATCVELAAASAVRTSATSVPLKSFKSTVLTACQSLRRP